MKKFFINKLSDEIINKFSISFLIKKPSCVLKELLENSLDALSSNISVYVEDFGIRLIRVVDNGVGIHKEDLSKIGVRFNTSKIFLLSDLNNISTYGFRGESLYVIKSLSKLAVTSKPYDQSFAYKIFFETDEKINLSITPGINGTTIDVKDLFYKNLEFRNFSKNLIDERNDILYVFSCIALSRFDVRFVFFSNGIELYNFPICNNNYSKMKRIKCFYPYINIDNVIDVNYMINDVSFYGFIYFDDRKKTFRKFNFFFVNNRIVNSDILDKVIKDVFSACNKTFNLSYCCYLYLNTFDYTIMFSVNKMDIFFKDYSFIYKLLFDAIFKSLNNNVIFLNDLFKNKDILPIKENNSDKFFCMNISNKKTFKNYNGIIVVLGDTNVCFYLENKLYFISLDIIRGRVLTKLFSLQFLKHRKILTKNILYNDLFSKDIFSIFLDFKDILCVYGFVFEIFNDKFLILKSIPVLLYNLYIDWNGLFLELKKFFEKNVFSSFSVNRFDINIINMCIKHIYDRSRLNEYEMSFFYRELVFSSFNDVVWFSKNCREIVV